MLDLFTIFTRGGIVLWCFQGNANLIDVEGNPINYLVKDVLAEGRGGADSYAFGSSGVQYTVDNTHNLVFAAVYKKNLEHQLGYVQPLLSAVRKQFVGRFADALADPLKGKFDFDKDFATLQAQAESRASSTQPKAMKTFDETDKAQRLGKNLIKGGDSDGKSKASKKSKTKSTSSSGDDDEGASSPDDDGDGDDESGGDDGGSEGEDAMSEAGRKKLEQLRKARLAKKTGGAKKRPSVGSSNNKSSKNKTDKPQNLKMDYSEPGPGNEADNDIDPELIKKLRQQASEASPGEIGEISIEDTFKTKDKASSSSGGFFSYFQNLTGGATITQEALEPVMEKMKIHLVSKNVASDIAEKLCASVAEGLVGKKQGTFQGLTSLVKEQLEVAVTQVLTPKRRVDILRDIQKARDQGRPYSMVFCGVNGVGKSTNLSKIAFWLLKNNLRVMIAACDTFRAGAVEQLKTHCRKLSETFQKEGAPRCIQLYDKGYGKDDAGVAKEAIQFARDDRFDVVLVDTAGRMQDNEKLMRSLAKLIRENSPDLVLFVGEALVGHEAVDQLTKFNQALLDLADPTNPRTIDGIVLTKFDTVDDKVGSTISMTYTTGQPIVFVGTGQTYTDLKRLNVDYVLSCLLRS